MVASPGKWNSMGEDVGSFVEWKGRASLLCKENSGNGLIEVSEL